MAALNALEAGEDRDRLRDAIVEAVGHLARMQRRKVVPLSAVANLLMFAVTGRAPTVPAKADPMAKEWGNGGA